MAHAIVWSYLNNHRLWSAYEPDVSLEIEKAYNASQQKINLGTFSPKLSQYEVDFMTMRQTQVLSGKFRPIQRSVHPPGSAIWRGIFWEFESDQPLQWTAYDLETTELIEGAYTNLNQPGASHILDLRHSHLNIPYVIDFNQMIQMRVDTGKIRRIQRRPLNQSYALGQLLNVSSSSAAPSSVASVSSASNSGTGAGPPVPQPQSSTGKIKKGKRRSQPYTTSSTSVQNNQTMPTSGTFSGTSASMASHLQSHPQQQQQLLQQQPQSVQQQQLVQQQQQQAVSNQIFPSQGMVTRRQVQQSSSQPANNPGLYLGQPQQSFSSLPHQQLQQPSYQQPMQSMMGAFQPYMPFPGMPMSYGFPRNPFPQATSVPMQISSQSQQSTAPPPAHQKHQSAPSSSSNSLTPVTESLPRVQKITIGKSKKQKPKSAAEVLKKFMSSLKDGLNENDCCICCCKLSEASSYGEGTPEAFEAVQLSKCNHKFHKLCLLEMYNAIHKDDSLQCPSCKTIYGEKTGICPPGFMTWRIIKGLTLQGHEGLDTICVEYYIAPGIQGPEHPCPGEKFTARGFPRRGFIPDCNTGRKILKLLIEAFQRRLMFTIGTSHTTGEPNTVTWNEIHHKTNQEGHGYPDPKYFDSVMAELAAHGVTEDCLS